MTKAWAWACLLLLLVTASAAIIPRQQLLPFVEIRLPVATITVVRTVTVEVATQTRIIFQPRAQTLTFTNPVVVFETRAAAADPRPFQTIAARGTSDGDAFDQESHPAALPVYTPQPRGATLFSRPARVQRQVLEPVNRASTITVEITTTLTDFVSVRTITAFNQVFVSVTVNETVTSTRFATTPSTETAASLPPASPALSSGQEVEPAGTSTFPSAFTSGVESPGTTTFFAPSETSAGAGVTTWFSTPSDQGDQRPTESPAASSTSSGSGSTATATATATATPSESPAVPAAQSAPGPALSPGTIASISLGAVTGVLFLLFLGFVYRSYRRYVKDRQDSQLSEEEYKMTSATAATAIMMNRPAASPSNDDDDNAGQYGATPGGSGSKSAGKAKQIRVVIRPVAKRQSEGGKGSEGGEGSGEVEARPAAAWQRASGYTSQGGYSISVAGASDSTLRDAPSWSNRSQYGSTIKPAASQDGDIPELPTREEQRR
ncbi:hypothetical protein LY76DRAFT_131275 [Colletotrichum caudatum]|nr:hypothetical protein LY76DRAFT_131275 [Colletotrichum caudatum]